MKFIRIPHPEVDLQRTALGADVALAATASVVDDTLGFANSTYALYGLIGNEKTEIVSLTTVTPRTSFAVHSALVFAHAAKTPIFQMPYNQVEISRADTIDGTYSVIATVDLMVDNPYTVYSDSTGGDSKFYKWRYKNVLGTYYSDYYGPVEGMDYTEDSLYGMAEEVAEEFGDPDFKEVPLSRIYRHLKGGVRAIIKKIIMFYPEYCAAYTTKDLSANVATYDLPSRFLGFRRVDINYSGTSQSDAVKAKYKNEAKWEPNMEESQSEPTIGIRGSYFVVNPTPTQLGRAFLYYWEYPAVMDVDTDEHGLPYGARDAIISFALYKLWLAKDTDTATAYKSDFSDAAGDFADFVGQQPQAMSNMRVEVTSGEELYED